MSNLFRVLLEHGKFICIKFCEDMVYLILLIKDSFHLPHYCRVTFETALKLRGGPSLVLAHSLGNNVFRHFLEWLKLEIAPKHYVQWLDEHIHAYFAVGVLVFSSSRLSRLMQFAFLYGM